MKSGIGKMIVIVVLLAAIAGVLALKSRQQDTPMPPEARRQTAMAPERTTPETTPESKVSAPQQKAVSKPVSRPLGPVPSVKPGPPKPRPAAIQPQKAQPAKAQTLPRLLELGADKCVPCKMMQPVLAELRNQYEGKMQVDFIDVWKDSAAGEQYGVQAIPTQIFFNADGKEIFRHTGFYPKDEILAKFKELGIEL